MSQDQTKTSREGAFVAYFIAISSLCMLLALALIRARSSDVNFAVGYNPYAMISFASAGIDAITVYLLLFKRRYSTSTNWFLLFVFGAIILAVAEGMQRLSLAPGGALFLAIPVLHWAHPASPTFYLFILSYTSSYKKHFALISATLMLTWGAIAFYTGGGLMFLHEHSQIVHTPWGFASSSSLTGQVVTLWLMLFYVLGTVLLIQFRRSATNTLLKRQATLFIVAFLLPYLAFFITNIVFASIVPNVVPPLATLVGAFSALLVYYGIRQYRLFDIDPQILAQNILDTMSEAVIIVRPDHTIESLNPEAEKLLGIESAESNTRPLRSFFTDEVWELILGLIESHDHKRVDQLISKSQVITNNGQRVPVRIAVTTMQDEYGKMADILVLSDISELTHSFDALQESNIKISHQNDQLKELEIQLRDEKASVEHTVEVRTKELVDAQAKLKETDKLKTEFIVLTSHNLRTPLTIAQSYADLLAEKPMDDQSKEAVSGLRDGIKRLGSFVEDLLTINSIKAGDQLILQDTTLHQVLDPLVQETQILARTKSDKFVADLPSEEIKIKANVDRLQSAIRNLISNAIKYTDHGTVELSATKDNDHVQIKITDTGIGIVASEVSKLFTEFHRADDLLTSEYEGEGIGLYITKLIVDEHKGQIHVTSEPKKGSTFTIELPCY